jgi:hypothetical protein
MIRISFIIKEHDLGMLGKVPVKNKKIMHKFALNRLLEKLFPSRFSLSPQVLE